MTPRSQNSDFCPVKSGNISFQWFPAVSSTSAKNPSPSSKIVSDFTRWEISTQRGHLRPLHHDGFLYQYNQWSNQCLQLAQRSRNIKGICCPLLVYFCTAREGSRYAAFLRLRHLIVCHTISEMSRLYHQSLIKLCFVRMIARCGLSDSRCWRLRNCSK